MPSINVSNIPDASAIRKGLVTTGSQTFGGTKTFSNIILTGGVSLPLSGPVSWTGTSSYVNCGNTSGHTIDIYDGSTTSRLLVGNVQGGPGTLGVRIDADSLHSSYLADFTITSGGTYTNSQTAGNLHLRGGQNYAGGTNSNGGQIYIYGGAGSGSGTSGNVYLGSEGSTGRGLVYSVSVEPLTDNTYYLGRNDDDSPKAWKGVILKDTTNGKYYRIEIISGVITATDLTD